jgi:hypothetical protein
MGYRLVYAKVIRKRERRGNSAWDLMNADYDGNVYGNIRILPATLMVGVLGNYG